MVILGPGDVYVTGHRDIAKQPRITAHRARRQAAVPPLYQWPL